MTTPRSPGSPRRAAHRSAHRRTAAAVVATLLAVVLAALVLVAVVPAPPAAALRSGPDVAVRLGLDARLAPGGADGGAAEPGGVGGGAADDGAADGGAADGGAADSGAGAGADARAAGTGYVPPVAGVDPPAGVERLFDPPAEEWGAGHRGVDLAAAAGARVLSPGPGVVTFAGQVARRGVVVVTHPDGLRSSLEPVAASVPVGTAVAAGTAVGVVEAGADEPGAGATDPGTTQNHCAPRSCVHWGVRRGERYVDPLSLLDRPPIVLLPDR
ncbi:murein hydrolase activator EnvC family protein [Promicromonospora sp. NPDC060204]|uniref:murein hydrolase activator EnvC family protein n=1 Tax=Promicromonospora sp. NPDC060204 TaxID=3347071 RepID=UPI0036496770